ncbi:MAG: hybrid sensor histidine kinase/response regulator [Ignavibacteriales bacterium]|nr:hybrid sensor histidine kinase/response regulator [Ignavibacteriales bacterium]
MKKSILVVEHENETREKIREILLANDYTVFIASSSKEAIRSLNEELSDLIIVDMMMPEMNGIEFLESLHRTYRLIDIPFIILTPNNSHENARLSMLRSADDYLIKPFKTKELTAAVSTKLNKAGKIKEQYHKVKDNILLSVPHELRTPLMPINSLSDVIEQTSGNIIKEDLQRMGSKIQASAIHLNARVEKFIILSDISYKLTETRKNHHVANHKLKDFKNTIEETIGKELKFYGRADDAESSVQSCPLQIDEFYFTNCVKELAENACKFSEPDTCIKISGRNSGTNYVLSFENTSNMLTPARVKNINIYNKYMDSESVESGLGLPFVKKATEYFGGELELSSGSNQCTKISMHIPRAVQ